MEKPFIQIDAEDFYIEGFDPKPLEFPFCCPKHTAYFEGSLSWFLQFPDCCNNHKRLKNKIWFGY